MTRRNVQKKDTNKNKDRDVKERGLFSDFRRAAKRAAVVLGGSALISLSVLPGGCGSNESGSQPSEPPEKSKQKSSGGASKQTKSKLVLVENGSGLVLSSEEGSRRELIDGMRAIEKEFSTESDPNRYEMSRRRVRAALVLSSGYYFGMAESGDVVVSAVPDVTLWVNPRAFRIFSGDDDFLVKRGIVTDGTSPLVPRHIESMRQDYGVGELENADFLYQYGEKNLSVSIMCNDEVTLGEVSKALLSREARSLYQVKRENADEFFSLFRANATPEDIAHPEYHVYRREDLEDGLKQTLHGSGSGVVSKRAGEFQEYKNRRNIAHIAKYLDADRADFLVRNDDAREFVLTFAPHINPGECQTNPQNYGSRAFNAVPEKLNKMTEELEKVIKNSFFDLSVASERNELIKFFYTRRYLEARSDADIIGSDAARSLVAEEYREGYIIRNRKGREVGKIGGLVSVFDECKVPEKLRTRVAANLLAIINTRCSGNSPVSRDKQNYLGIDLEPINRDGIRKVEVTIYESKSPLKKIINNLVKRSTKSD